MDLAALERLGLRPDLATIHQAFELLSREIFTVSDVLKATATVHFGIEDSDTFNAVSSRTAPRGYSITLTRGLCEKSLALFRQLTLANSFGKYSQERSFDMDALSRLLSEPGIKATRAKEPGVSIDSLLGFDSTPGISGGALAKSLRQPFVDAKHQFDVSALFVPSLLFVYWHELAHIVNGHLDWFNRGTGALALDESGGLFATRAAGDGTVESDALRSLEYWADDFAARRLAVDMLASATRETEHYVLGPFWFNRENFNVFGQLDGFPGETIAFNLEGFFYRVAFALTSLVFQFDGFFQPPRTDYAQSHPHPEVRLSHIIDAVKDQFGRTQGGLFASMWEDQVGYALHTANLAFAACGASRTPFELATELHLQEIGAKTRRAGTLAREAKPAIDPYALKPVDEMLDPAHFVRLPQASRRAEMLGFDVAGP